MGSKRLALIIAFVTIVGGIPAVGAEHLSVGYEDAVGVSAEETSNAPSVDEEDYLRGIAADCFEANESRTDPGQIQDAAGEDPFCGDLLYQNESNLSQVSPPDQDYRGGDEVDIAQFDVRTTRSYMLAHELRLVRNDAGDAAPVGGICQPFCEDNPAGALLWDTLHDTGAQAGLTNTSDEADDRERDDRGQIYGADVHTLTARSLLQEAETHEMNGWYIPGPTRSFVAFLYDSEGQAIGEERLADMVERADLPGSAVVPSVCGWTPDADFVGTGDAAQCEVEFAFEGSEETSTDFTEGYRDKCKSPAYVCGAQSGGAWYANFDCICGNFPLSTAPPGLQDYIRWHFVVAPTLPDCGAREPGFLTELEGDGASYPYLAHDVDVYTNAFALQATQETRGATQAVNTASQVADHQVQSAFAQLPALDEGNEVSPPPEVSKDDRVEPNAEPVNDLEDTSQSLFGDEDLVRSLTDPCEQLVTGESEDTIDPWVDIIDSEVVREVTPSENTTAGQAGVTATIQAEPGLYQNGDEAQDENNHPGPDLYHTSGNVGMFTDKNDNGVYDTIAGDTATFSESKLDPKTIEETGAYPMFWDVRVEETDSGFQLDDEAGCQINGDELTDGAKQAGYGPETGLFQAIYLSEPTAFVNTDTGDVAPYTGGNNIYLLLSHSARQLYDSDESTAIDTAIEETLDELEAYASDQGADASTLETIRPGDELDMDSDYGPQCPERTGGFTQELSFLHACQVDCSGDTIVTRYVFDLEDDKVGGGIMLPVFTGGSDEPYTFPGENPHTWTDVDPFDNDPDRNDDSYDRPPTGE